MGIKLCIASLALATILLAKNDTVEECVECYAWSTTAYTQGQKAINLLTKWEENTLKKRRYSIKKFDQLRFYYKGLESLLLQSNLNMDIATVNNNKFWLEYLDEDENYYPEAGAFQIIEQLLTKPRLTEKEVDMIRQERQRLHTFFEQAVLALEKRKLAEDDLFHLLANSLNYHYLTTLNAYDRIDTEKALLEFKYVINTQIELLSSKTLSLEAQKIVVQLDNMLLSLKNQSWEEVDRVLLYKQWIAPIIKQYSNLRISSTKNEVHFDDSEALLFSSNFLNANTHTYDIDTTNFEDLEELGRLLFYDPMLSGNNKRSCASCHKPSKAFSDGRQTSIAFDYTSKLKRNAPSLVNSIYKGKFLHDLSKDNLFDQITAVINHSMEFNTSWKEIEQKIESSEEYVQRFETCFSSTSIDSNKVADALTAYLASLTSFNSPFDQYMSGKSKKKDAQVEAGYNLFMGEASCGNCHVPPLFGGVDPVNFKDPLYFKVNSPEIKKEEKGLATNEHYDDRYNHFFAVPSLRNLNYTTPYFHNGSLLSLEACIDAHTLEGSNFTKELTENQKSTILYFLETLNDTTLTNTKEHMNLPLTDGTLAPKKRRSAGIY